MTDVRTLPVGEGNEEITLALDELAREGARRMIAAALRAEADEYVERFSEEVDEDGHRLVVRNGRARERQGDGRVRARSRSARRGSTTSASMRHGRAAEVQLADPAGVCAAVAEGRGGDPDPVPPRPVDRRLPPGAGGSARRGRRRAVGDDGQPAVQGVGGPPRPVPPAAAVASAATPTCSWTGSTSRSGSVRTRRCAC